MTQAAEISRGSSKSGFKEAFEKKNTIPDATLFIHEASEHSDFGEKKSVMILCHNTLLAEGVFILQSPSLIPLFLQLEIESRNLLHFFLSYQCIVNCLAFYRFMFMFLLIPECVCDHRLAR